MWMLLVFFAVVIVLLILVILFMVAHIHEISKASAQAHIRNAWRKAQADAERGRL